MWTTIFTYAPSPLSSHDPDLILLLVQIRNLMVEQDLMSDCNVMIRGGYHGFRRSCRVVQAEVCSL